jgi:hypothetical protein
VVLVLVVVARNTQLEVQSQGSKHATTITWPSAAAAANHHQCHHTPVAWHNVRCHCRAGCQPHRSTVEEPECKREVNIWT